jgi:hypothetical protein
MMGAVNINEDLIARVTWEQDRVFRHFDIIPFALQQV